MVKVREDIPVLVGAEKNTQAGAFSKKTTSAPHASSQPANSSKSGTSKSSNPESNSSASTSSPVNIDIQLWLKRVCDSMAVPALPQLEKACAMVAQVTLHAEMHEENKQMLYRADAYETGIGVADILSYLVNDEAVLVAAMLFRAARRGLLTSKDITNAFDEDIAHLVFETMAMGQLSDMIEQNRRLEDHFENNQKDHLAGIYKMLISVTNDVRVVLIKLAERTFALRQLEKANAERQQRVAREIMSIYAPLAHRLGIAQLKWELEDLAFRYLAPVRYKEIAKLLSEKRTEREQYIETMINTLKNALAAENINAQVTGRVKHIYSIYKKMKQKALSFDQLYDIRAVRVLVDKKSDCYHVLGVVHELWRHIPEQFDDYITNPKANGYRSLHTAVIAEHKSLEVQIRTQNMHFEAELGVCAHVNYKEGTKSRPDFLFDSKLNSLRQILANYQDKNEASDEPDEDKPLQDWSELERIYVFTRDGDIQELPKGATVLDFAYYVHTEIGNKCAGARVNKSFVPLTYVLKTGEQVDILTRKDREPKRDWLVASLGYIKTSRARAKLKHWFNQQDRGKNIQIGQDMLNQELVRLGLHPNSIDLNDYLQYFKVNSADDVLVALVNGDIQLENLTQHISKQLHLEPEVSEPAFKPSVYSATGSAETYKVAVDGIDNIDIRLAQCCYPLHGEPIIGFITKQNGVSIHHQECVEVSRLVQKEPERSISATWHTSTQVQQLVKIGIEAYDRRGLLKDLTQIIDRENVNIVQVHTMSKSDGCAYMTLDIEVAGLNQLSRLLAKLEQQPGIISARRQQHG